MELVGIAADARRPVCAQEKFLRNFFGEKFASDGVSRVATERRQAFTAFLRSALHKTTARKSLET